MPVRKSALVCRPSEKALGVASQRGVSAAIRRFGTTKPGAFAAGRNAEWGFRTGTNLLGKIVRTARICGVGTGVPVALAVALLSACTFEESLAPELLMSKVGEGRIAPHGTTRFAFSEPLENEYVELAFIPDHGIGYHTYLTPTKDTLVLDISGMLPGNSTFTVSPTTKMTAESGDEIAPYEAKFTLTTYPTEDFGNNGSATATPFEAPMYGTLENGYDTDCFVFTNISNCMVRLTFEQGVTSWTIRDGAGAVFEERTIAVSSDSIYIDASRPQPVTLCLNPLMLAPDWYRIDTTTID